MAPPLLAHAPWPICITGLMVGRNGKARIKYTEASTAADLYGGGASGSGRLSGATAVRTGRAGPHGRGAVSASVAPLPLAHHRIATPAIAETTEAANTAILAAAKSPARGKA